MAFSYAELCKQAKQSKAKYLHTVLPVISMSYTEFAEKSALDTETMFSLRAYNQKTSRTEKHAVFESIGFNVIQTIPSILDVWPVLYGTTNGKSLEDQFLDNERNLFILNVYMGLDSLFFILEYPLDNDPLATYTVDDDELNQYS